MSEAVAARRIRAGRATCRFPCILGIIARGEIHLSGIHQLAGHLTDENHREVLQRAKYKSMREIEKLVAEISPKPDVPTLIRALPIKKSDEALPIEAVQETPSSPPSSAPAPSKSKAISRPVPLAPRRYKLQVTIGEEARDKLSELQDLLSHQIPDGDPAQILERALDALLTRTKKKKAAITDSPRRNQKVGKSKAVRFRLVLVGSV